MKKNRQWKREISVDFDSQANHPPTKLSQQITKAMSVEDDHFDLDCEYIIKGLTDLECRIFTLLFEGYTIGQIAKKVEMSKTTTWRRINVIRAKVKRNL